MLSYLVTSRARRALLHLLWREGQKASVSALAKSARLSFSTAQRELVAMEAAGLAVSSASENRVEYRANPAFVHAALLRQLLDADGPKGSAESEKDVRVRGWLKMLGAPLAVETTAKSAPAAETVVLEALELARRDATVARALPVLLWRQRAHLNWQALHHEARAKRRDQALGFFVELAARLGGDRELAQWARSLHDQRRKRQHAFFTGAKGRYAHALEKRNTPPLAKRWGFTMNMPLDSFATLFEKFA